MSVNKYIPHVIVIPEDDANSNIANGFLLHENLSLRAIQVMPAAGGWPKVKDSFGTDHVPEMRKNSNRHVVLLVDFDQQDSRLETMKDVVPQDLSDRVFIVGVWSEPEDLRTSRLGSMETVGTRIADECDKNSESLLSHDLFRHNAREASRMSKALKPILFQ